VTLLCDEWTVGLIYLAVVLAGTGALCYAHYWKEMGAGLRGYAERIAFGGLLVLLLVAWPASYWHAVGINHDGTNGNSDSESALCCGKIHLAWIDKLEWRTGGVELPRWQIYHTLTDEVRKAPFVQGNPGFRTMRGSVTMVAIPMWFVVAMIAGLFWFRWRFSACAKPAVVLKKDMLLRMAVFSGACVVLGAVWAVVVGQFTPLFYQAG